MANKRSIFEEVGDKAAAPAPVPRRRPDARRAIAVWLAVLFALIVAMIVVGGMTRLTDSGLVDHRVAAGDRRAAADGRRRLDRRVREVPGDAAVRGAEPRHDARRVQDDLLVGVGPPPARPGDRRGLGAWASSGSGSAGGCRPAGRRGSSASGVLGGLQGAIGWWMVRSGLAPGMEAVASYRLAVHLGLAFVLLGLIAWYVLRLGRPEAELLQARRQRNEGLIAWGTVLVVVAFAQVLLGALVAGIDAGRNYTDWPLMGGEVFPSTAFDLEPAWSNFLDNPGLVQFNHRLLGYVLLVLGIVAWLRSRRSALEHIRGAFAAMAAMLVAAGRARDRHGDARRALADRHRPPARRGGALRADRPRPLRGALSAAAEDRPGVSGR